MLAEVNVDEEPQIAAAFGVFTIPTTVVLLPSNAVVRSGDERTVVAAMEPPAAMGLAANAALEPLAAAARERIERAMASI